MALFEPFSTDPYPTFNDPFYIDPFFDYGWGDFGRGWERDRGDFGRGTLTRSNAPIQNVVPRHARSRVMAEREGDIVWRPATDVYDTEEAFVIHVDLPGVPREDISIDLRNREIVIFGESKRKPSYETASSCVRERNIGRFRKHVLLPPREDLDLEQIKAAYENGLLEIRIPRKNPRGAKSIPLPDIQFIRRVLENSRRAKSSKKNDPPRPPNAFFLFRNALHTHLSVHNLKVPQVSSAAGRLWDCAEEETKNQYTRLQEIAKVLHLEMHPGYVYRPRKSRKTFQKIITNPSINSSTTIPPLISPSSIPPSSITSSFIATTIPFSTSDKSFTQLFNLRKHQIKYRARREFCSPQPEFSFNISSALQLSHQFHQQQDEPYNEWIDWGDNLQ
ncbi:8579_t:CDS:10 [Diversispora eburnea]|uniref:8579_t:CDS:1 n=1 Tax=Diversispora eburnea TaxID=1213867 RepID=A0A9N8V067_9GLOM|nr:8579_t:CDS:10 [Diversispora eburnea]